MVKVFPVGGWGVTGGVYVLIDKIENNVFRLVRVIEIEKYSHAIDTADFTYIALFREKETLGGYVAFVNEWGTNYGKEAGGTGGEGYRDFSGFLNRAHESHVFKLDWEQIPESDREIIEQRSSQYERMKMWGKIIMDHVFPIELDADWDTDDN